MKIEINNQRKIFAIQKEFCASFPGLKIEFHEKPNKQGGPPSEKLVKSNSKTLAECRSLHNEGFLSIHSLMTTGDVKQMFRDNFGLTIEIFQKTEDNSWRIIPVKERSILQDLTRETEYLKAVVQK